MRVRAWPAFASRTRNPYNWLLYTQLRDMGVVVEEWSPAEPIVPGPSEEPTVYHLHWPEHLLLLPSAAQANEMLVRLGDWFDHAHADGHKVFWTVHSLKQQRTHHPELERPLFDLVTRRVDAVIHMSDGARRAAENAFPAIRSKPNFVIPHGHYRDVYPNAISREDARQALDLPADATVMAFVGCMRYNKNLPSLVRAMRGLADPNTFLLLHGEVPDRTLAAEIAFMAGGDQRVRFTPIRVEENALQRNLKAADLVVLPYTNLLNSGAAMLGLSFDRPVLVPESGAMPDLQEAVGRDWVFTYQGELSGVDLAVALEASVAVRGQRADLSFASWDRIAAKTLDAYREITPQVEVSSV